MTKYDFFSAKGSQHHSMMAQNKTKKGAPTLVQQLYSVKNLHTFSPFMSIPLPQQVAQIQEVGYKTETQMAQN